MSKIFSISVIAFLSVVAILVVFIGISADQARPATAATNSTPTPTGIFSSSASPDPLAALRSSKQLTLDNVFTKPLKSGELPPDLVEFYEDLKALSAEIEEESAQLAAEETKLRKEGKLVSLDVVKRDVSKLLQKVRQSPHFDAQEFEAFKKAIESAPATPQVRAANQEIERVKDTFTDLNNQLQNIFSEDDSTSAVSSGAGTGSGNRLPVAPAPNQNTTTTTKEQ